MPLFPGLDDLARDAAARRDEYECAEYRRGASGRVSAARVAARQGDCRAAFVALSDARKLINRGVRGACPAISLQAHRRVADAMARSIKGTCRRPRTVADTGLWDDEDKP